MTKKRIIVVLLIAIFMLVLSFLILSIADRGEKREALDRAQALMRLDAAAERERIFQPKGEEHPIEDAYYYVGSAIKDGKLQISLLEQEGVDNESQKQKINNLLSEYKKLIEFRFYTYEELFSLKTELAEKMCDDIYSDLVISLDKSAGELEIQISRVDYKSLLTADVTDYLIEFSREHAVDISFEFLFPVEQGS